MIKLVSWILRMVTGFFSLFILIWTIIGAFWLAASSTCKGKDPTAYRMQVRLCPVSPPPPVCSRLLLFHHRLRCVRARSTSGGARNSPTPARFVPSLSLHSRCCSPFHPLPTSPFPGKMAVVVIYFIFFGLGCCFVVCFAAGIGVSASAGSRKETPWRSEAGVNGAGRGGRYQNLA